MYEILEHKYEISEHKLLLYKNNENDFTKSYRNIAGLKKNF